MCDYQMLTEKEEALMRCFWAACRPITVKELREMQPEPLPHVNTVATFVKLMENKGYLTHEAIGNSFIYSPAVSPEQYASIALDKVVKRYFNGSIKQLLSFLADTGTLSDDDMWDLMNQMRQARRK